MKEELEKLIEQVRTLRSKTFGNNEDAYSALGKAMGRLIDAKKSLV